MPPQARDNRSVIPRMDGSVAIGSMFSKLKAAWSRLAGGWGVGATEEPPAPAVEYKGYRIRAAPYRTNGAYQTAGIIEKDTPEGVKEHRFIRADTHQGREDAMRVENSLGWTRGATREYNRRRLVRSVRAVRSPRIGRPGRATQRIGSLR